MFFSSSYFILSPDTFRPGTTLTLKVTILKALGPVDITAGIKHSSWSRKDVITTSNKTFRAGKKLEGEGERERREKMVCFCM